MVYFTFDNDFEILQTVKIRYNETLDNTNIVSYSIARTLNSEIRHNLGIREVL